MLFVRFAHFFPIFDKKNSNVYQRDSTMGYNRFMKYYLSLSISIRRASNLCLLFVMLLIHIFDDRYVFLMMFNEHCSQYKLHTFVTYTCLNGNHQMPYLNGIVCYYLNNISNSIFSLNQSKWNHSRCWPSIRFQINSILSLLQQTKLSVGVSF